MADTKDWTWVLERPCPDCSFDAAALPQILDVPVDRLLAQIQAHRARYGQA